FDVRANADCPQGFDDHFAPDALAAAGKSVSQNQCGRGGMSELLGELQVALEFAAAGRFFGLTQSRLLPADAGDLGPHQCAIDEIQTQNDEAWIVACLLQVAIQEPAGELRMAAVLQVHHDEGDLTEYVYPTQLVIEFDAVKDRDPPLVDDH